MLVVSVSTPGDIQMPAKFAARPVMHGSSCAQKLVSQYDGGERRLRSKQSLVSLEVGPTGTRESEAQLLKLIRLVHWNCARQTGKQRGLTRFLDIDEDVTPQVRAELSRLIDAELPADYRSTLHPSLPKLPPTKFSPLIEQELERKARNEPISGGVDLSRYEAPEIPPSSTDPNANPATVIDDWKQTLRRAYAAHLHLSTRKENLALLEAHGKNAWLIGNMQLEEILRRTEKELHDTTEATEAINRERKLRQESVRGELAALEDTWRRGVSGTLNVEIAAEKLRRDILDMRRQQAQS
ncbi:BCAS2 domain-containing protein [Trichophyton rubrum]|uniref:BCAS2 domain-containing protein n=1 Tax=Trichophyton rubrum TaxID=5551 RepID=A0A178EUP7_TRIRU|nr:BCAS2 domain-containing protein [Trichophyton rubrum]